MVLCDPALRKSDHIPRLICCELQEVPQQREEGNRRFMALLGLELEKYTYHSLEQFFERNSTDSLLRNLEICISIVAALSEVHERGFTHGSICPPNIWAVVNDSYSTRIKLANYDFSAAREGNPRSLKFRPFLRAYEAPETAYAYGWTFRKLVRCDNF